jgi:hypothetical protein
MSALNTSVTVLSIDNKVQKTNDSFIIIIFKSIEICFLTLIKVA